MYAPTRVPPNKANAIEETTATRISSFGTTTADTVGTIAAQRNTRDEADATMYGLARTSSFSSQAFVTLTLSSVGNTLTGGLARRGGRVLPLISQTQLDLAIVIFSLDTTFTALSLRFLPLHGHLDVPLGRDLQELIRHKII